MTSQWHLLDLHKALLLPNSTFNKCITQCGSSAISIVAIGEEGIRGEVRGRVPE